MRNKSGLVWRLLLAVLLGGQLACSGLLGERSSSGGVSGSARPAPHFRPGFNLFSPKQDVEIGRQSAAEISQQVQLLRDEAIVNYVRQVGSRLAAKAPGEDFPYQFNVIATREVNAFALPGGFIFVNAGTIAAAKNEGELAGVIAHEITHVALRHGTNQASKAYLAKAGLGILGSVAGDDSDLGRIVESVGGAGANMLFLKFGRTAERQADLEGARIMAEAGYDPRDMAGFFKTLQAESGQRGPEFLSDHPDPGNRVASINEALPSLPVPKNPVRNTSEFQQVKARLTGQPLKGSSEPERVGPRNPDDIQAGARPQPPAAEYREFRARDGSFAFQYPQNWDGLASGQDETNLIFAPKGAYGQRGEAVYATHGIFVGTLAAQGQANLEAANAAFVQQQVNVNTDFRVQRPPQRINFNGRQGFATVVAGPSPVTGVTEIDVIYTTATADGRLFYLITIAPEDEFQKYQPTFERITGNLRLE
ncbi:MAG TPA: M48 family metallopeptidase [Pyrinomonadaceae bacterium]|jgi:Zn-dependent protease with chaperone function|nr:M48 family metallopeptidase [Pyrinomonadaceae bacterium]